MADRFKVIGGLSRKARFNITAVIVLLFIIIFVFTSINQIKDIVEKRRQIAELEEKLAWQRNENIGLLAAEKSLYEDEGIESEARRQFNMTFEDEKNISVRIEDDLEETANSPQQQQEYVHNDLWGNIRLFYQQQISD